MEGGLTVYELHGGGAPRSARDLPRLVAAALRIMWTAGRREAMALAVLQAVAGAGLGLAVVLGGRVLDGVLEADREDAGASAFAGSVVALALLTAVLGVVAAVRREREELLAELTTRHAQQRVLDVACAVELAAFDDHGFHDRIARAQAGVFRTPMVVFGLAQMAWALAGVLGALGALLAIEPLLAPLALLILLPAWLVTSRRGEAFYRFAFGMTPKDRERGYLTGLLTDRDAAGRSVLLISHRFSSVRSADRVYVLAGGRVAESGTHEELMAAGGRYAELFSLQAAAYQDAAAASAAELPEQS